MLDGLRVLDLSDESGWLAGKILGDLGADVVKVEPPGGDSGRSGPYLGDVVDPDRSLRWLALNTSKRGITLAWREPRGAELLRRLADAADVLLETAAPGSLARLGLDYASLRRRNPRLVHCAITPFGQDGPRAGWRAHDLVVVAMGGNPAGTGSSDRPPVRCTLPTAYFHAAPEAATGIAMALFARESSGRGQHVDVSMHECQLATLMTGPGQHALAPRPTRRTGARLGRTREIWRAADGWISFGLRAGQARIPNLIATVGYMAESGMAPDWLRELDWSRYDPNALSDADLDRLEGAFAAFFASKTRRELYDQALARRILLAPCNDAREIAEQPQLRFREFFTRVEYPELGAALEHPDGFARSSACRIGIRRRAPRVGEHNVEVFAEIGVSAAELTELAREGTV
jgi:crotonobetainyl-CoA:carnitine CoA-transferase CaiB-like acyl-CoA transferase